MKQLSEWESYEWLAASVLLQAVIDANDTKHPTISKHARLFLDGKENPGVLSLWKEAAGVNQLTLNLSGRLPYKISPR